MAITQILEKYYEGLSTDVKPNCILPHENGYGCGRHGQSTFPISHALTH